MPRMQAAGFCCHVVGPRDGLAAGVGRFGLCAILREPLAAAPASAPQAAAGATVIQAVPSVPASTSPPPPSRPVPVSLAHHAAAVPAPPPPPPLAPMPPAVSPNVGIAIDTASLSQRLTRDLAAQADVPARSRSPRAAQAPGGAPVVFADTPWRRNTGQAAPALPGTFPPAENAVVQAIVPPPPPRTVFPSPEYQPPPPSSAPPASYGSSGPTAPAPLQELISTAITETELKAILRQRAEGDSSLSKARGAPPAGNPMAATVPKVVSPATYSSSGSYATPGYDSHQATGPWQSQVWGTGGTGESWSPGAVSTNVSTESWSWNQAQPAQGGSWNQQPPAGGWPPAAPAATGANWSESTGQGGSGGGWPSNPAWYG